MTKDETRVPLFLRVLFAPFALLRIMRGANWQPLERQIFDAVAAAVPGDWRGLLEAQMREINHIGRSHYRRTEVVFTRDSVFRAGRSAHPLPRPEPEYKLAVVDLALPAGQSVKASVWLIYGVLSIIEFNRVVDLREPATSIRCGLVADQSRE